MSEVDNIKKMYEENFLVFEKIFNLASEDIRELVENILKSCNLNTFEIKEAAVVKLIQEDKPYKIKLYFYDNVEISPFGIFFKSEHNEIKLITLLHKGLLKA